MDYARAVSVKVSTISHATEDKEKVAEALFNVFPSGFSRKLEASRVKGHFGNEITFLQIRVNGRRNCEEFFDRLWARLSESDRGKILSELEGYLDSSGVLHARVGKQASLRGQVVLYDTDPIKIEIRFMSDGSSRDFLTEKIRKRMKSPAVHNAAGKVSSSSKGP